MPLPAIRRDSRCSRSRAERIGSHADGDGATPDASDVALSAVGAIPARSRVAPDGFGAVQMRREPFRMHPESF